MEEKRKIYQTFMSMNAHKATTTENPTAHVMFYKEGKSMSPTQPVIAMDKDQIQQELDQECELVRWLLHQMSTYDCRRQRIVALIFDRKTVLSDVLMVNG